MKKTHPLARLHLAFIGAGAMGESMIGGALRAFTRFGIEYAEDPIAVRTEDEVEELAALRAVSSIPLAADECVSSPALAHALIDRGACDVLVLKPSSLGGLRATRQLVEAAQCNGMASTVTSSIDSAIGLSAVLHLAASLPGERAACGLATAELLAEDLAVPPRLDRGYLYLSDRAGFGLTFAEAQP